MLSPFAAQGQAARPTLNREADGSVSVVTLGGGSGLAYQINGAAWVTVEGPELPYAIPAGEDDLVSVLALGTPVEAPLTPPVFGVRGLIPDGAADFRIVAEWEPAPAGVTWDTEIGAMVASGTQAFSLLNYPLPTPLVAGDPYAAVMEVPVLTAGTTRPRLEGGGSTFSHPTPITYKSTTVRRFVPTVNHTDLVLVVPSDLVGRVGYANIFPLKDRIAAPADIYIFAGQSNMVGGSATADWDPAIDRPVLEALAVAGFGRGADGYTNDGSGASINPAFDSGYGIGHPVPMVHPVTHSSPNLGRVSPAAYIMRHLVDTVPTPGREKVAACMAAADTDLFFHWDPANDGRMYDLMVANVNALLARNPGSQVKGLFWCQGESSDATGYAALFNSVIDGLRASWGPFPLVIMEIGGQPEWGATIAMNAEHAKLATGSGAAEELADCIFLPRPEGATFIPGDDVHYDGATNRLRGQEAAEAFLATFG